MFPLLLSSFGYRQQPPSTYKQTDITTVSNYLQQKNFGAIIRDPQLFKDLFYKTIADNNLDGYVSIKRNRTIVTAEGHPDNKKKLDKHIEILRESFARAYGLKQNFTACAVNATSSDVVFEPTLKQLYTYNDYFSTGFTRLDRAMYANLILPVMQQVAESLAATCTLSEVASQVSIRELGFLTKASVDVFSIVWSEKEHFVYPVPPVVPQKQPDLNSTLYDMYTAPNQPHCDLVIQDRDGNTTKVHSLVFLACEGTKLQGLLASALAKKEKKLVFETFGMEPIKKFIDFVYLGPDALDANNLQTKEIVLKGLLTLAHTLEMPAFMDCCTNLLSLTATKEDTNHIRRLADLFNNEHLRALYEYLATDSSKTPATGESVKAPDTSESVKKRSKVDPKALEWVD